MPGFDNTVSPFEYEVSNKKDAGSPVENRRCRDVPFVIIFVLMIGGMGYCSYVGLQYGDPYRLAFGVDSWGNVCNRKNSRINGVRNSGQDTRGKGKLFFFEESVLNNYVIGQPITYNKPSVCVTSCPSSEISSYSALQNYTKITGINYCIYGYSLAGNSSDASSCPDLPISKQKSILFRCVPSTISTAYDFLIGFIDNLLNSVDENFTQKCLSDLEKSWREICYLCAIGFGVSIIIVHLLRFVAGVIIWIAMFILGVGSMVAAGLCWYHYYLQEDESKKSKWLIASICVTVIMILILLILLVMRKRIGLVVELFKEAGKAITDMPFLIFQPVFTFLCLLITVTVLLFFLSFIVTSDQPVVNYSSGFVSFEKHHILKYMKWYYLFGFIWVIQFIFACDNIVISGAIGQWYFIRNKKDVNYPVCKALKNLIRYSLGSAVLGSLVITLVFAIRVTMQFIHNRLKNKTGPIVNFILKCCCCLLWCFEKFIKFINSSAYAEIAITGKGFCVSAKRAFGIVVGNALRLSAINSVGDFTLFLGKLAPVCVVAVVGLEILTRKTGIYYLWFPITISCLLTYLIASCFLGIYEKCIDTLFVCFCEDCEINDGEQRPYFMSVGLMKYAKNDQA